MSTSCTQCTEHSITNGFLASDDDVSHSNKETTTGHGSYSALSRPQAESCVHDLDMIEPSEYSKITSESSSNQSIAPSSSRCQNDAQQLPAVKIIHKKSGYEVQRSSFYRNSLLWQVGLLEFTNALDFPANVWNNIPIPLFAQILMGIGGSIAILWTAFAVIDLQMSLENIKLLREERRFMKEWQRSFDEKDSLDTRRMVQAWLDVSFREIGWESIDRIVVDVCSAISGVLVGTGALMAIRGDIPEVFIASNLLSGYIGNSFLAPFALCNAFWAIFMWIRAGGEQQSIVKGRYQIASDVRGKMKGHGDGHRLYALLNGCTAVVGAVGSILSSTLWYGYVIIAPCVFTSLFCNLYWRNRLGYDRTISQDKHQLRQFDIFREMQILLKVAVALETGKTRELVADNERGSSALLRSKILALLSSIGLYGQFCCAISEHTAALAKQDVIRAKTLDTIDFASLVNDQMLINIAVATIERYGNRQVQYRGRFLIELLGRYFKTLESEDRRDINQDEKATS